MNRASIRCKSVGSSSATHSIPVNGAHEDLQKFERSITNMVRSEVDSTVAMAETRVYDTILAVMDSSVILGVELAMKSINASSGRDRGSVPLDPDQINFSGNGCK